MQISRIIEAPSEKIWDLLVDTRQWPAWGPSVKAVDCDSQRLSAGMRGRVRTVLGIWVPFIITRWEPLRYWDWRVAGVAATGHRVEALNRGRCRLTFSFPTLLFPYALVCRRAAENIARMAEIEESAIEILQRRSET